MEDMQTWPYVMTVYDLKGEYLPVVARFMVESSARMAYGWTVAAIESEGEECTVSLTRVNRGGKVITLAVY